MTRKSADITLTLAQYESFLVELRKSAKPIAQIYDKERFTGMGRYNAADLFLEELPGILRIRSPWTQREGVYGDIQVVRGSEMVYLNLPGPSQDGFRSRAFQLWIPTIFLLGIAFGIYTGNFLGFVSVILMLLPIFVLTAWLVDSQYNKHRSALLAVVESSAGKVMRDSTSSVTL